MDPYRDLLKRSTDDQVQASLRKATAIAASAALEKIGNAAFANGHILGTDRKLGESPFGHGSDDVVAMGRLLQIAGQLVSGSSDLIGDGRVYAGSALLRQLVEVEYLTWTFANDPKMAKKWLRSDKKERMNFFSPRKLRSESMGFFRDADYSFHCELGGHPVPGSSALLQDAGSIGQIMLSDAIAHSARILKNAENFLDGKDAILSIDSIMIEIEATFEKWRVGDELNRLPPPPTSKEETIQ
jgi:hypothetical protein